MWNVLTMDMHGVIINILLAMLGDFVYLAIMELSAAIVVVWIGKIMTAGKILTSILRIFLTMNTF
jgi:hypothetical protein